MYTLEADIDYTFSKSIHQENSQEDHKTSLIYVCLLLVCGYQPFSRLKLNSFKQGHKNLSLISCLLVNLIVMKFHVQFQKLIVNIVLSIYLYHDKDVHQSAWQTARHYERSSSCPSSDRVLLIFNRNHAQSPMQLLTKKNYMT